MSRTIGRCRPHPSRWMNIFLLLLVGIGDQESYGKDPIDLVFDIDWTSLYIISDEQRASDTTNTVDFDETYRYTDFLIPVLHRLHQYGRFRISLFSGGKKNRNEFVADHISKSLNQLEENHSRGKFRFHKVLSYDDLTRSDADESASFTDKFDKDLRALGSDTDLDNTVLIDDQLGFSAEKQERNHLHIGTAFSDIVDWDRFVTSGETGPKAFPRPSYRPPSKTDWLLERSKLLRVLGVLDHALSITDQEGIPFTDAVNRVVTGEVSPERMSPGQAMSVARGLFQLDRRVFTTHEKKVAETFLDETVKQMGLQLCTLMTTQSAKPKE